METIAFRVDASEQIGSGHVMRCLTIAHALKERGARTIFICNETPEHMAETIRSKNHIACLISCSNRTKFLTQYTGVTRDQINHDVRQTGGVLTKYQPSWLIVDHYGLDSMWEQQCRKFVDRIFVVDDLANRNHDCDVFLDPNFHQDPASRYSGKLPKKCVTLFGPRYAVLRPEFQRYRNRPRPLKPVKRVLVAFGGHDSHNNTHLVLECLSRDRFSHLAVDIVISRQHRGRHEIEKTCCSHESWRIHVQTQSMARLMARADLAIGAGGTTTWERIYLGLPAFVKIVASNQAEPLRNLEDVGQVKIWNKPNELEELLDTHLEHGISLPSFEIHNGTNEVAETIIPSVELVPFSSDHLAATYTWIADPHLQEMFMFSEPPTIERHLKYWSSAMADPGQRIFAILYRNRHVGNCGLRNFGSTKDYGELWIYIGRDECRGNGIGEKALQLLQRDARQRMSFTKLYLHVGKNNPIGMALYRKAGFVLSRVVPAEQWGHRRDNVIVMEKAC